MSHSLYYIINIMSEELHSVSLSALQIIVDMQLYNYRRMCSVFSLVKDLEQFW